MAAIDDNFNERLSAITETLELVAGMQLEAERRIDKLLEAIEKDGQHINALVRIAAIHERRLADLEGGIQ